MMIVIVLLILLEWRGTAVLFVLLRYTKTILYFHPNIMQILVFVKNFPFLSLSLRLKHLFSCFVESHLLILWLAAGVLRTRFSWNTGACVSHKKSVGFVGYPVHLFLFIHFRLCPPIPHAHTQKKKQVVLAL